ncbi:conserved hypothetical protein [Arthrobacter sp. 9AX]|uniref:hypothetical protein n=1 Tax=Arthrobacter sp. 9AX TaxID=2653131 RepID=UPI0012F20E35|nr:hypothetical protein [Arthrobacter sp. 9AX]VXC15183.1 conserved hypothetical protein [Arthrobacter sp. 9AX]
MSTTLTVSFYLLNAAVFILAATRPSSTWLAADRNRGFWLTLMAVAGLLCIPGLLADAAFLIGVLPRMLANRRQVQDPRVRPNPFIKR